MILSGYKQFYGGKNITCFRKLEAPLKLDFIYIGRVATHMSTKVTQIL